MDEDRTARRHDAIRLYDGPAPGSEDWPDRRSEYYSELFDNQVVTNVVVPTATPVVPDEPNGTAIVVAPGGGFHALSIESEGFEVAEWLADRGVTAFVLEYRLVPSGDDAVAEFFEKMLADADRAFAEMNDVGALAATDARTAVRWVRTHAAEYAVRPDRVGCIGFSAGGNVVMRAAFSDDDARPDFLAPIYASVRGVDLAAPPPGGGPMFITAATDDALGLADDSVAIYEAWRRAGLPVELHMYATGGHGFGMKQQGLPSDRWVDRFGDWLACNDLL